MSIVTLLAVVATIGFSVVFQPAKTSAATADTINFQAKLETNTGAIAPDGNYNVQFKLYNVSTGGSSLWSETYDYNGGAPDNRVRVVNGYLTVNLGSITPFPSINWDQNLYVTMNIGGTGTSATYDGEMTPRLKLTAVPYAFSAGNLAHVNSGTGFKSTLQFQGATGSDQTIQIPDLNAGGGTTYSSDNVCLQTLANCTGTGGGIAGSGLQNFVAKFDTSGGNHIGNSSIFDNGTFVGINNSTTNNGLLSIQGASGSQSSLFVQGAASASAATVVIKQASGQTGDLIDFADSAGNVNGSINATGNVLSLGKVGTTNPSQGKIVFGDGTNDNLSLTLQTATLSGNSVVSIPATTSTDTVCLYTLANCVGTGGGIAGSGSNNYVPKFGIGGNTIGNSSIQDNGTTVTVGNNLAVTGGATANNGLTIANSGSLSTKAAADYTATGPQTDVNLGSASLVRLNGASAQTINSIAGGSDGRILTIVNAGSNPAIIKNNGTGTTGNQVITGTGSDLNLPSGASISLIYDAAGAVWRVNGSTATTGAAGVNTIGAVSTTPTANGATITGTTLNLAVADGSNPGLVSATTQTIGGAKTFSALLTGNAGLNVSGGAVTLQGTAASSITTTAGDLTLDAAGNVNVGTTTATGVIIGRSGITTTIQGSLAVTLAAAATGNSLVCQNTGGTLASCDSSYQAPTGTNFIQNQNAATQVGTFKINGTGTASTLQISTTGSLDTSAAGALNIGLATGGNATSINLNQNTTVNATIGVGTAANGLNRAVIATSSAISSGSVTMSATSGTNTFTTSSSITLNAGDYIVPASGPARTVTTTATGTSFTVNTAYGSSVTASAFTIYPYTLGVQSLSGTNGLTVSANGNVGINNSAPTQALDVNGNVNVTSNLTVGSSASAFVGLNGTVTNIINANNAGTTILIQGSGSTFGYKNTAYSYNSLNVDTNGNTTLRSGVNAANGLAVQNAAGNAVFAVNTATNNLVLGKASSVTTNVVFQNSTNTGTITLATATPGAGTNYTVTLPAATGTVALTNDTTNFIRNQTTQQTGSNFNIDGTGIASVLQAGTFDTNAATALNIGTTNATSINLNQSTVVAANQTITFTGGTTANRPASPTEGMEYYDTTTKQLLVYANGKWQGDRSTATKIVAASNASQAEKDGADYVATGTNDQTVINAALTAAAGGKVVLTEGTFTLGAAVSVPNNTTLAGAGRGTVLQLANLAGQTVNAVQNSDTSTGTGVTIRDLVVDGNKTVNTTGTMDGIYLNNMGSGSGSSARIGGQILNVSANNFITYGIYLTASNNNTLTNNVVQANSLTGLYVTSSSRNNITGNTLEGNGNAGFQTSGSLYIVFANNNVVGNATNGISLSSSGSNTITGNNIRDNGGTGANDAVKLSNTSSNNTITGNTITDTAGTGYAINISDSGSTSNYLSNNTYTGTGATTMNDSGTTTIFGGQLNSTGAYVIQPAGGIALTGNTTVTGSLTQTGGAISLTGNAASSITTTAGNLSLDSAATVQIGTSTATGVTIGKAGTTTTIAGVGAITGNATVGGTLGVTGATTLGSTLNVSGLSTLAGLTNTGATLLSALAVSTSATGPIGTGASTTVDVATTLNVTATTAGQVLTLASPTNTTAGRIIYVSNVGTNSFTIYGITAAPGTTQDFIWNGTAWTVNGSGTTGNYIQNGTTQQTGNFNIISANAASIGAVIQAASGQSADIFEVKSSVGSVSFGINAATNPYSNSGFQINNGGLNVSGSQSTAGASAGQVLVNNTGTNGNAASRGIIVRANAAQSANTLEIQDSSSNFQGGFSASGNQLTLGNNTATGTSAGSIRLTDGTSDGFYGTLNLAGAIGANQTYSLPATGGTLCVINSASCGAAGTGYIQNGTTTQSGNFNIQSASASSIGAVIQGASGQTASLLQVQDSTGAIIQNTSAAGNFYALGDITSPNGGLGTYGNLLQYSEQFDNAVWTPSNIVVTANDSASNPDPQGNTTADKLVSSAANATIQQTYTTTTNGTYSYSVWLKTNSGTQPVSLRIDSTGATPTTGTAANFTATTTWQRLKVTQTFTGTPSNLKPTLIITNSGATVVAWGAQLITGSNMGVYVRTEAATFTPTNGLVSDGTTTLKNSNSGDILDVYNGSGGKSFYVAGSGRAFAGTGLSIQTTAATAQFNVSTALAGSVGAIINGSPSQTADLLQFQNNSATILSGFLPNGDYYSGSTTSGNYSELAFTAPTGHQTFTFPATGGTVCIQASSSCGFETTTGTDFIQNQSATAQNGNFYIQSNAAAATATAVIKQASGQTGDLLDFQNSAGSIVGKITPGGYLGISSGFKGIDTTAGATNSNALSITTGNATGTNSSSGNISLDSGTSGSGGTNGTVSIGGTNASGVTIGRSGVTTTVAGNFDQSASTGTFATGQGTNTLNGNTTVASGKNFSVTSGTVSVGGVTDISAAGKLQNAALDSTLNYSNLQNVTNLTATGNLAANGTITTGTASVAGQIIIANGNGTNSTISPTATSAAAFNLPATGGVLCTTTTCAAATGAINGSGTANQVARFTGTNTLGTGLLYDTGTYAGVNITSQLGSSTFGIQGASGQVSFVTQGASGQNIALFKDSTGANAITINSAGDISTAHLIGQSLSLGTNTTGHNINLTNTNTGSSTITTNGFSVGLTGTANSTGANVLNGLSLNSVTAKQNNTFNGLSFGSNYTNGLYFNDTTTSSILNVAGASIINGSGVLQNAGLSSAINYSNLQNVTNLTATGNVNIQGTTQVALSTGGTTLVCTNGSSILSTCTNSYEATNGTDFIQNQVATTQSANFNIQGKTGNVAISVKGESGGTADIADFYTSGSGTKVTYIDNSGNLQTTASVITSGNFASNHNYINVTGSNTNTTATAVTSNAYSVSLGGTTNTSGGTPNTINGLNLNSVTARTGNQFNGIYVGTGYDNVINVGGQSIINGAGVLQSAGLAGSYTGSVQFNNAGDTFTGASATLSGAVQGGSFANTGNSFSVSSTGVTKLALDTTAGANLVCQNASLNLSTCSNTYATGSGAAILQGGNAFSGTTAATIGTTNNGTINFLTNNTTKAVLDTSGNLTFQQSSTIGAATNGSLSLVAGSAQTSGSTAPGNINITGGSNNTNGNVNAGNVYITGGTDNSAGTNSGTVYINGGISNNGINGGVNINSLTGGPTYVNGSSLNVYAPQVNSGSITQNYATNSGSGLTLSTTNNSASGSSTVNADSVNLAGHTTSGANTINGLNFGNVTTIANNTFNGLYFGTGYNSVLNVGGNSIISGAGVVQNAGLSSAINYSNLQTVTNLTATGNLAANGTITTGTASVAGQIIIANGNGTNSTISPTATSAAAFTLPATGGVLCTTTTCATGGTGSYIQNQSASAQAANFFIQGTAGTVSAVVQGATGGGNPDIIDFNNSGGTKVAYITSGGSLSAANGTFTQSTAGSNGGNVTSNVTNTNTTATAAVTNGFRANLTGTTNNSGGTPNILNGLALGNVTPVTGNFFSGISLGTGYNSFLSVGNTNTVIIDGNGVLQSAGLAGAYGQALQFTNTSNTYAGASATLSGAVQGGSFNNTGSTFAVNSSGNVTYADGTSNTGTLVCKNASGQLSSCNVSYATATGANYIAKNSADSSTAAVANGSNLLSLTNSGTGTSGVLALTNSGTNSALSITQSGNPTANQALIFAKNTNASPTGNLIDLQVTAGSKFSIATSGNIAASGSITGLTGITSSGSIQLSGIGGAGVVQSDASGNITSSSLNLGTSSYVTGTLGVAKGGTGLSSYGNANGLLYGNGTTITQTNAASTAGQIVLSNGTNPAFITLGGDIASVSGTGSVTVGGVRGQNFSFASLATGDVLQYNGTNVVNGKITNTNFAANTQLGNVTGVGALVSGSIGSGFGTISTGSTITTSVGITAGTLQNTGGSFAVNASGNAKVTLDSSTGSTLVCQNASLNLSTCTSSYETTTGTDFIQNQNGSSQAANFKINGTGVAASLQAGSFDTSAAAALSIGTSNATSITLGGASTTNVTISAKQFTNNGSTVFGSTTLPAYTSSPTLSPTNTVDLYTTLIIPEATGGLTINLPTPTANTTAGRLEYVINTGTQPFTMQGVSITASHAQTYVYDGAGNWTPTNIDGAGSGATFVGAVDSIAKTGNGGSISGNGLYLESADANNPGLVTKVAQTFGGDKTFAGNVIVQGANGVTSANLNSAAGTNTAIGNSTGSFSITSQSGLNVTTGGDITGVSTLSSSGIITVGALGAASGNTPICYNGSKQLASCSSAFETTTGTDFIQNQNSSSQAANFKINGTGVAATLQASLFDSASSGVLAIGTTNATQINLNQNVQIAAGKNITFAGTSGNFDQSASTSGTFATGGGSVSLNGATTVTGSNNFAVNGGSTTLGGSLATKAAADYTATGPQDGVSFGNTSLVRLNGSSAQTINGIAGGTDGRILTIVNAGANAATLGNNASATNSYKIVTGTGAAISLPSGATISLIYDAAASVWRVSGSVSTTGGYIQLQGSTPGTAQTGNFNISGSGIASILQGSAHVYTPDLDTASAGALSIGANNATSIGIAKANVGTTVNGSLTVAQLLTGQLGATVSGAAVSLNASSNFATSINTGSSTGTVSIGNSLAGIIGITSGAAINITAGGNSTISTGTATLGIISSNFNVATNGVVTLAGGAVSGDITTANSASGTATNITLQPGTSGVNGGTAASVNLLGGNQTGTSGTRVGGSVTIDAGTGGAAINNGSVAIGTANASAISLGHTGITTTNSGALSVSQGLTANGGITVAANQAVTLQSGSGVFTQNYTSASGSGSVFNAANSSTSATTVNGLTINPSGTNTSGNNTVNGLNFGNASNAAGGTTTFNGLNFGTGYNSLLTSANATLTGAGALTLGAGSNTGSISVSNSSATTTINASTSATPATGVIVGTDTTATTSDILLNLRSGTTPTTKFTVDAAGNVVALGGITAGTTGQFTVNGTNGNVSTTGTLSYTNGTADSNNALVCRNTTTGQLTACSTASIGGNAFVQGGNSFSAQAVLGTKDNYSLALNTNNTTKAVLDTTGNLQFQQASNITTTSGSLSLVGAAGAYVGSAGGASTYSTNVVTGNATAGNSGDLILTTGTSTGGTAGSVYIGTASNTATNIYLGNGSNGITANSSISIAANQSLSLANGTGTIGQIYTNNTGSAETQTITNSSTTSGTVNGISVALTGTNASGANINNALNLTTTNGATNNTYNGINFGTGYTNLITSANFGVTAAGALQGTSATLSAANALTLGLTGTNNGAIVFKGSTAASGQITLVGPANPSTNNYTLSIPALSANATLCTTNNGCSSTLNANYLSQNPTSNTAGAAGANIVAPTSAGIVGLLVNGTSNATAADAVQISQSGAANALKITQSTAPGSGNASIFVNNTAGSGNFVDLRNNGISNFAIDSNGNITQTNSVTGSSTGHTITATNASGTQDNGFYFNRNAASGTTTNGFNATSTAGTLTNGVNVNTNGGTITTGVNITNTTGTLTTGINFGGTLATGINFGSSTTSTADISRTTGTLTVLGNSGIALQSTGNITIGSAGQTGASAITLGQATGTNTITIGSSVTNGSTQTINLGTSVTSGSTTNVFIGSTVAGATILQSPTTYLGNANAAGSAAAPTNATLSGTNSNSASNYGGNLNIVAGSGVSASTGSGGGTLNLNGGAGGTPTTTGNATYGGAVNIFGGAASGLGSASASGGNVSLNGGAGYGSGGMGSVIIQGAGNGAVYVGSNITTNAIYVGGYNQSGTITIGQSQVSNTITIGSSVSGSGNVQTINLGTSTGTNSSTAINIGSTVAGITTLQSAGGTVFNYAGTANATTITATANPTALTNALVVINNNATTPSGNLLDLQNKGTNKFTVDVNGNIVNLGGITAGSTGQFTVNATNGNLATTGQTTLGGATNQNQLIIKANGSQSAANALVVLQNSSGAELARLTTNDASSIFLGSYAGNASSGVLNNTGIGAGSLTLATGNNNTAVGAYSLTSNQGGSNNTAVGTNALLKNTTGGSNTATGLNSAYNNTTGLNNNAYGQGALYTNTTGSSNEAFGNSALYNTNANATNGTGSGNIGIGDNALSNNTTGSGNIGIGYQSQVASGGLQNAVAIGTYSVVSQSNSIILGCTVALNSSCQSAYTNVGIGTATPTSLFSVGSSSQFQVDQNGNTQTTGTLKVGTAQQFTVDASGNIVTTGTYNGNQFTSSALTFSANSAATIKAAANQNLVLDSGTSGGVQIGNTNATSIQLGSATNVSTKIQSSSATVIQSTSDNSNAFSVQNSTNGSLISVDDTYTASANLATNGGAENAFAGEWAAYNGGGAPTRDTTAGHFASGVAAVNEPTTGANQGVKYIVGTAVTSGVQYQVSFSVKSSIATAASIATVFSYNGSATAPATCGSYGPVTNANFVRISCNFTPSTTTTSGAYFAISQTDGNSRSLYIDNLSIVQQTTTSQNVGDIRIGGATGQGLTLLTLDSYAGVPFTGSIPSLAGSLYFDTTSNKIQCYDGTSWGACGAAPNTNVTLTPEYAGAVLDGSGIGTLTSDFCGVGGGLGGGSGINPSLCASGEARNFYKWTSPQSNAQAYSIYVTYKLPSTFKGFVNGTTSLNARVDNLSNASVSYQILKSTGSSITSCSANSYIVGNTGSSTVGAINTWTPGYANASTGLTGSTDPSTCGFAANNYIIFQINVSANSSNNAYVENLNFSYTNQ